MNGGKRRNTTRDNATKDDVSRETWMGENVPCVARHSSRYGIFSKPPISTIAPPPSPLPNMVLPQLPQKNARTVFYEQTVGTREEVRAESEKLRDKKCTFVSSS